MRWFRKSPEHGREDAVDDEALERRLVIRVNSNAKMTRGKAAAHAVHAALKLYGIDYDHPVIVIGGKPDEILAQTVHVRDAGRTELEPGTLTAGASWEYKHREEPADAE